MVKIICFTVLFLMGSAGKPAADTGFHPVYLSVTELNYNASSRALEVTHKLFVDDFEKTLRAAYKVRVDLLNPQNRPAMEKLIDHYIQTHFKVTVNGQPAQLKFLGYEHIEEGIYSYFEAVNTAVPKEIDIFNNLLYEYQSEQMGIMHCNINGKKKSTKLNNPDSKVSLRF